MAAFTIGGDFTWTGNTAFGGSLTLSGISSATASDVLYYNAGVITHGAAPVGGSGWSLTGNAGTGGTAVLGTTDANSWSMILASTIFFTADMTAGNLSFTPSGDFNVQLSSTNNVNINSFDGNVSINVTGFGGNIYIGNVAPTSGSNSVILGNANTSVEFNTNVYADYLISLGQNSGLTFTGTGALGGPLIFFLAPPTITSAYDIVLPAAPPTVTGQNLQVGTITGNSIQLVWA